MKASDVTALNQEMSARTKIQRVGIDIGDGKVQRVPGPALRALGREKSVNLNDGPYAELVNLTIDAGLNSAEITDIATRAKETGSDTKATEFLTAQRQEMAERIVQKRMTGIGVPSAAGSLRRALGNVTKYGPEGEPVGLLVETNPTEIERYVAVLTAARNIIGQVLELQAAYQPVVQTPLDEAA
jgi:hypothetical protein